MRRGRWAILVLLLSSLAYGQFGSTVARRIITGTTAPPATCNSNPADVYIRIGATLPGLYECLATNTWTGPIGVGTTPGAGGSSSQLQFNNATVLGGVTGWTTPNGTTTITAGATSVLDLSAITLSNFKLPAIAANSVYGNCTGSSAAPSACSIVNAMLPTTMTGITIDGVTPTVMGYVDPTSSIQTQLNGKAASNAITTVNGQSCALAGTCTIPFQTNTVNNTSQSGLNFLTSTANAIGLTATPVNSATNAMKIEITGVPATATDLASGSVLALTKGGTGVNAANAAAAFDALAPTTTQGDMIVRGASSNVRIGIGTAGLCWVSNGAGANPSWQACATGSVGAGSGLATNAIPKATASFTLADSLLTDSGTALGYSGTGGFYLSGSGTFLRALEGAAPTGSAGSDWLYADSTAHRWKVKNNSNTADTVGLLSDNLSAFATGGAIAPATVNGLTLASLATGFSIAGGTASRTLTVDATVSTSALAPLASPTFTGTPAAPTPVTNINTTQIPTTAWVNTFYAPLASPTFTGTVTGTFSGNLTGNVTGNASTATDLASGSILSGAKGGTGNGFFAVTGPATSLKTFTFPNASATVLTTNAAVTAAQGGTGADLSAAAAGRYPKANGSGAFATSTLAAAGTGSCTNQVVTATNGDAAPSCTTVTSAYVNNTIALTGTDINTSNQVIGLKGTSMAAMSGLLKVSTGTPSVATAADVDSLYTGTGKCYLFKGTSPGSNDGCDTPPGTISGLTAGRFAVSASATTITDYANATVDSGGNASFASVTTPGDGTHAGNVGIVGNTTAPSLTANTFNLIGPATATFTAFGWQFPSAENGSAGVVHIAAASAHVSALSVSAVALSDMATQAGDTVLMNASGSTASPAAVAMPTSGTNGCAGATNALSYNTTTHAWGCNTISANGTVNSGTAGHLSYYATSTNAVSDMGADFTFDGTHTLTAGASAVTDFTAMTASNFKTPASITLTTPNIGVANGTSLAATGQLSSSYAGTASNAALTLTGNAYAAGTGTTNFPQLYIKNGASGPTTWSTAGTQFGINATSGFTGNLMDFHINGGASVAKLDYQGNLTVANITGSGSVTMGANGGSSGSVVLNGSTSGSATITVGATGILALPSGTTATNMALTTPSLGVATATSVNKVAITAPATSATLTIADGKTLTASNTLTFTGTDSSSVAFGTGGTVTYTIASGTSAMGTGAISSGTCATVVTTSATGTATTDTISYVPNTDPTAVTGYGPSASGSLYIWAYPTANNVNFKVCNNTSGSITPSALTLNWKVSR